MSVPYSCKLTVPSHWIDGNGHMHDAQYLEAFNQGVEAFFGYLDLNAGAEEDHMIFNLGLNMDFHAELFEGDAIRLELRIVDRDYKRLHLYSEMFNAQTGVLCATLDRLFMNISRETRRSTPFLPHIMQRIETVAVLHAELEKPPGLGRSLGIRHPSGTG